jgi:hypothetical protein
MLDDDWKIRVFLSECDVVTNFRMNRKVRAAKQNSLQNCRPTLKSLFLRENALWEPACTGLGGGGGEE